MPVVIHDDSLVRTTDVEERFAGDPRARDGFLISDFDLCEVETLDAGSWFVSGRDIPRSARSFGTLGRLEASGRASCGSGAVRIPRLVDALRLTVELDWLVNVEIKACPLDPPGLTAAVLAAIAETRSADRVLISSFDHRIVAALARSRPIPGLACGILVDTPLWELPRYAREIVGAQTVHVSAESLGAGSVGYRRRPGASALHAGEIASLRDRGIPVLVYTVNDHDGPASLAGALAQAGVAGLFTDDPRGMRRSFDREAPPPRPVPPS